ncbi:hypothetical protein N9B82_00940 [Saprospiraceae bacterium]|nr:hypothetical protein [Saprospiraceae bacterium]
MKKAIFFLLLVVVITCVFKYAKPIYHYISKEIAVEKVDDSSAEAIENRVRRNLRKAGIDHFPDKLSFLAFKEEQLLQIYSVEATDKILIAEYPFTAFSGRLGPKLKEGDKQIPEGIYKIEYLKPNSSYHLSLKVSYPNDFDKARSALPAVSQMGGDVFIHGKALTIGCIPIGDRAIEEVFFLAEKAIHNEIKVIISPRDFRNNAKYPNITGIEWEEELYEKIKEELLVFPL